MATQEKTALELAQIVRKQFGEKEAKIGVFFDKAKGWRAVLYSAGDIATKQAHVNRIVDDLLDQYVLIE